MKKLTEALTKCEQTLDLLRQDLLEANKISSVDLPVAHIIIKELLTQEVAMEAKLNELLACIKN